MFQIRRYATRKTTALVPRRGGALVKSDQATQVMKVEDQSQTTDVLLLNGDIASKSLACALSLSSQFNQTPQQIVNKHHPITLLNWEHNHEEDKKPAFATNLSHILLSPTSLRFLNSLGVLALCDPSSKTTFNDFTLYEDFGDSYLHFSSKQEQSSTLVNLERSFLKSFVYRDQHYQAFDETQNHLGLVINKEALDRALTERLNQIGKCKLVEMAPEEVWRTEKRDKSVQWPLARLEDGSKIEGKVMIVSGQDAHIRKELGMIGRDYSHTKDMMVCLVETGQEMKSGYQRFLSGDTIMMIPIGIDRAIISITSSPEKIEKYRTTNDENLIHELNEKLQKAPQYSSPLGGLVQSFLSNSQFQYPPVIRKMDSNRQFSQLIGDEAENYVEDKLALIGNSAHNTNNFGLLADNITLNDAALLANTLIKARKDGDDIGDKDYVLNTYEKQSKLTWKALKYSHEQLDNQYKQNKAITTSGDYYNYAIGGFRNLMISSLELSDLAKFNLKNLLLGNLPSPQVYEWETNN